MASSVGNIKILSVQDNRQAFEDCIQIIQTSYGPEGRLKIFQNEMGSFLSMTSSSSRIFNSYQVTNPALQVIVAALKGHIEIYKDSGLFTALLTIRMIFNQQDTNLPVHVTLKINDYLLEKILCILDDEQAAVSYKIDIGKLSDFCKILTAVLRTKKACQISSEGLIQRISVNILKAVIKNFPESSENSLHIIACEGPPEVDCSIVEGLLIRLCDLDAPTWLLLESITGECKMAVFATSLAGDDVFPHKSTVYTSNRTVIEDAIFNDLRRIADELLNLEVKLVLCQKVVHPLIKRYLRIKGTLVLDRLGLAMMSPIENLTGCLPIRSPSTNLVEKHFGIVKKIETFYFHDKSYLWMHKSDKSSVNTLIICGPDENTLDELKCVCESVQNVAYQSIRDSRAVSGSGCFEIQVASRIRQISYSISEDELLDLNCTKGQFILGADAVARSYEYIARMCNKNACEFFIDSYYNHLWTIPPRSSWKSAIDTNSTCCCGHIKFNGSMNFRSILEKPTACNYSGELQNVNSQDKELPDVLDLLVVKRASMTLATELANTVLRIKHTIIDNG